MSKLAMSGTVRVRDVMSESLLFLATTTSLDQAWSELHEASVSGAPVLDDRGRLVGIISLADQRCASWLLASIPLHTERR